MLGAIIGDIAGSHYEFNNLKNRDFDFFVNNKGQKSFFTDDTVLTIAIANIVLDNDFSQENIINRMKEWTCKYQQKGYGTSFLEHFILNPNPKPYNSMGNGAAMKISSIALYYDKWCKIEEYVIACTQITHNHPEGIKGALAIAKTIYLAKEKISKEEIKFVIEKEYGYNLTRTLKNIQRDYTFELICPKSVPESIICFLEANNYENTIRNCMYLGGDCDTISAMAGGIAEAYYGIEPQIIENLNQSDILTNDIQEVIKKFYQNLN